MARISKEDQARIRNEIIQVAAAKFTDAGFENVSTKEIAKQVGIAEGTLFNYFDSKTHLFLEVFSTQFSEEHPQLSLGKIKEGNLVDVIFDHMNELLKMMLRLPKGLLSELLLASIRMAKKHPEQFRRFVELDFQYMKEMGLFLNDLQERKMIQGMNTKLFSEMIYGIAVYEFTMYLYDSSYTKEDMKRQIKSKLEILLKGFCIGG